MQKFMLEVNEVKLQVYESHYSSISKEVILLLHPGGIFSSFIWDRMIPAFQNHYRVIAVDIRGHGESERPIHGYDINNLTKDIYDVFSQLNINKAHVIGNSLGCLIGLSLAKLYPDKVLSLVNIDGGMLNYCGEDGEREESREDIIKERNNRRLLEFTSKEEFMKQAQEQWANSPFEVIINQIPLYQLENQRYAFQQTKEIGTAILETVCDFDVNEYYSETTCPVLFLPAEVEPKLELKKRTIKKFQKILPYSKLVIIPESEHIMMIAHSEELAHEILQFYNDIQAKVTSS